MRQDNDTNNNEHIFRQRQQLRRKWRDKDNRQTENINWNGIENDKSIDENRKQKLKNISKSKNSCSIVIIRYNRDSIILISVSSFRNFLVNWRRDEKNYKISIAIAVSSAVLHKRDIKPIAINRLTAVIEQNERQQHRRDKKQTK